MNLRSFFRICGATAAVTVLAIALAGCGSDDGDKSFETPTYPFSFEYPSGWTLSRSANFNYGSSSNAERSVSVALKEPFDTVFFSLVAPFKGTRLRTDMLQGHFGEMSSEGEEALEQLFPAVHNAALPAELLLKLRRQAYWRFYRRPRTLANLALHMTSATGLRKVLRAVRRRIFEPETSSLN